MPKLGRPTSRNKRLYFNSDSEVQKRAPFGTNYTPSYTVKIVGSKYKKYENDFPLSSRSNLSQIESVQQRTPLSEPINRRPILPPIYTEREKDYDLSELCSLIPPTGLPNRPLILNSFEQLSLLKIAKEELMEIPDVGQKIKKVYLDLAKIDVNLTGHCSFKEFIDSCYGNDIHLALQFFRVVAALFVVPSRDDDIFINYESVISFLGAVYKSMSEDERLTQRFTQKSIEPPANSSERSLYYHDENCLDADKDIVKNGSDLSNFVDDSHLIKIIMEDIGFRPIPIQKLRLDCQRTDNFHRGTLSAKQVFDICQSNGFILHRGTFDRLIQRCRYMGGGQFYWQDFINFLEKVQPINTGLHIPSSKMPLDFAKPIPFPTSSWPHSEAEELHHETSRSNVRDQKTELTPKLRDFSQQYTPRTFESGPIRTPKQNYETTAKLSYNNPDELNQEEPWFNRFLKFVDAVYIKDVNSRGILPTPELYEIALDLNQKYGLSLTKTEIVSALEGSSVDHDRYYSNLNSFLKRLAMK